mmetsp:Transcript_24124/g.43499  ORF Transcript_24124/g.43499 Transcript_24124/m.43499 type:complete len:271 (-) Transcript_24124:1127-1939(-)
MTGLGCKGCLSIVGGLCRGCQTRGPSMAGCEQGQWGSRMSSCRWSSCRGLGVRWVRCSTPRCCCPSVPFRFGHRRWRVLHRLLAPGCSWLGPVGTSWLWGLHWAAADPPQTAQLEGLKGQDLVHHDCLEPGTSGRRWTGLQVCLSQGPGTGGLCPCPALGCWAASQIGLASHHAGHLPSRILGTAGCPGPSRWPGSRPVGCTPDGSRHTRVGPGPGPGRSAPETCCLTGAACPPRLACLGARPPRGPGGHPAGLRWTWGSSWTGWTPSRD